MKTTMLADLEAIIQAWIGEQAEGEDWPAVWYPEDMNVLMARAAAAVFDANVSGQEFAKTQEPKK